MKCDQCQEQFLEFSELQSHQNECTVSKIDNTEVFNDNEELITVDMIIQSENHGENIIILTE